MAQYDVVVIGSGFGGAVVAARLAEAGRSVCLLERGARFSPHDYPRTFSQAQTAVWDEGSNYGFLDYRVFGRIDVIQGAGVGGGSLHYFNVQMRAPAAIFERPDWPAAITRATLDPYYARVEEVTRPAPLVAPAGERTPARTQAFLDAARRAGYDPYLVPIAVHTAEAAVHPISGLRQEPCTMTADCLLGCKPRAKNSLDLNYLPLGERHGLEIRPLHQAERIEPLGDDGYAVTVQQLDPTRPGAFERTRVEARQLVLSAGALGSTELLLRARDVYRSLPDLPGALGRRWSGNGDMLFAATKECDEIIDSSYGPSITAGAYVQPAGSRHLILVEDLAFPPALTSLFDGTLPIPSRVRSLAHAAGGYVRAAREGGSFPARSLFRGSFVPRVLPYLGMGTDAGDGRLRIDQRGRLRLDWNPAGSAAMYGEMEAALRKLSGALGGDFVRSMPWRRPFRRLLTAHPLGGCVMSDAPARGVVNDRGQVWGHPGLFVADSSILPGAIAANPSLTIAALAERVAEGMVG